MKITIGSRGSKLALIQSEIVKNKLLLVQPDLQIEIKTITTKGDRDMNPIPLDSVGKGWFTKELDKSLLKGEIDIAIHSLKDLPEDLPSGLVLAAIPEREDAREVLVSKNGFTLAKLPKGAVIGTDSERRKVQILNRRPDLVIKSMRGNVPTRLEKLQTQEYDAVILAAAGLIRLGLTDKITQYFDSSDFIPSPGQGALGVVARKNQKALLQLLERINHAPTIQTITAERAFSRAIGGGCKTPVGAYAECNKNKLVLYGMTGSLDGQHLATATIDGKTSDSVDLGTKLAKTLIKQTVRWNKKEIVITRSDEENKQFKQRLEKEGFAVFAYPCIETSNKTISLRSKDALTQLQIFDWIVFTSARGVDAFLAACKKLAIKTAVLKKKKIAAVGPSTRHAVKSHGYHVDFIPSTFTTKQLAHELPEVRGKKFLLARSAIVSSGLVKILKQRGAEVTNIPIYKTTYPKGDYQKLKKLVLENKISLLTFTSPSTVTGFIKSIKEKNLLEKLLNIPVISIGPVTTKAAKRAGFMSIQTAEPHTVEGMILMLNTLNS